MYSLRIQTIYIVEPQMEQDTQQIKLLITEIAFALWEHALFMGQLWMIHTL